MILCPACGTPVGHMSMERCRCGAMDVFTGRMRFGWGESGYLSTSLWGGGRSVRLSATGFPDREVGAGEVGSLMAEITAWAVAHAVLGS